jgi:hypothetical protein
MRVRFDSHAGPDVPAPEQALEHIQAQLAAQQKVWAQQLADDPASLAQLEPQVHHAFGQLADRLVASLLAHAAARPALAGRAKKK